MTGAPSLRERGIIMTGESVGAIMAGRKTQTRRLVRFPVWACGCFDDPLKIEVETADDGGHDPSVICNDTGCLAALPLPFRVGDRLWVREGFAAIGAAAVYRAGHEEERCRGPRVDVPWRSPIHMPRWASRLTLTVTAVRVQRLQDISCADAIAEGILPASNSSTIDCDTPDPRYDYRDLWNTIHGPGAWDRNPWVAAISFTPTTTTGLAPSAGEVDHG